MIARSIIRTRLARTEAARYTCAMFGRKDYQIDRQHDAHIMRVAVTAGGAGFIWGLVAWGTLIGALAMSVVTTIIGLIIYYVVAVGGAKLISHTVLPDTRGQAGVGYSHIEAMEARGDIA